MLITFTSGIGALEKLTVIVSECSLKATFSEKCKKIWCITYTCFRPIHEPLCIPFIMLSFQSPETSACVSIILTLASKLQIVLSLFRAKLQYDKTSET